MKKWIHFNLFGLVIILGLIGAFNYMMDPLWCFSHKNILQSHQKGFNERQQKINLILFSKFNYDAIMLGSSRVTFHNTSSIKQIRIFNMAADAMQPNEFEGYIDFAKEVNKKDFKTIILGLDIQSISMDKSYNNPTKFITIAKEPLYRLTSLISYDTFSASLKNIKFKFKKNKPFRTYDQNHEAHSYAKNSQYVEDAVQHQVKDLKKTSLIYNRTKYLSALRELKEKNPKSKIIVFTTPLPTPIIQTLLKDKKAQEIYKLWLKDIFNIFGPFYHFLNFNTITNDYQLTFIDAGHYRTEVGNCINHKIMGNKCSDPEYKDFGLLINNDTLKNIDSKGR